MSSGRGRYFNQPILRPATTPSSSANTTSRPQNLTNNPWSANYRASSFAPPAQALKDEGDDEVKVIDMDERANSSKLPPLPPKKGPILPAIYSPISEANDTICLISSSSEDEEEEEEGEILSGESSDDVEIIGEHVVNPKVPDRDSKRYKRMLKRKRKQLRRKLEKERQGGGDVQVLGQIKRTALARGAVTPVTSIFRRKSLAKKLGLTSVQRDAIPPILNHRALGGGIRKHLNKFKAGTPKKRGNRYMNIPPLLASQIKALARDIPGIIPGFQNPGQGPSRGVDLQPTQPSNKRPSPKKRSPRKKTRWGTPMQHGQRVNNNNQGPLRVIDRENLDAATVETLRNGFNNVLQFQNQNNKGLESRKRVEGPSKFQNLAPTVYVPPESVAANANDRVKGSLRPIIIDGSNVAMQHGKRFVIPGSNDKPPFSCKGIEYAVEYFKQRGHTKIKVLVPAFRLKSSQSRDTSVLQRLEKENILVSTPSRRVNNRDICSYDDRFILEFATQLDGIVVSCDNFRDLFQENPELRPVIENRLLPFVWLDDIIMFPSDPLGARGPNLDEFLKY